MPTSTTTNGLALLRLLQLTSPQLPIGAFAYSQGLERAVHDEMVTDESSCYQWVSDLLSMSIGRWDLPILARLFEAVVQENWLEFKRWDRLLFCGRETMELRAEEKHLARAFAKVVENLPGVEHQRLALPTNSFAGLYAAVCYQLGVSLIDCQYGFGWMWVENQVAAATKIIPLGQTQSQNLLFRLSQKIQTVIEESQTLDDDQLASGLPFYAAISSWHEKQYSRLFRS